MLYSHLIHGLATAASLASSKVQASSSDDAANTIDLAQVDFRDDFSTFDASIWQCEYQCPSIKNGIANFTLQAGGQPDTTSTWSKAVYHPRQFTSGNFSTRFALTKRPKQAVWWGVALYSGTDDAPNEINFGYTTDESLPNSGLRFESYNHGVNVSIPVDVGVDLYDGRYHTGVLKYDSKSVAFYFDGKLVHKITDQSVIPRDPMDFIIGGRLVTGSKPLTSRFTQYVDWVEILA